MGKRSNLKLEEYVQLESKSHKISWNAIIRCPCKHVSSSSRSTTLRLNTSRYGKHAPTIWITRWLNEPQSKWSHGIQSKFPTKSQPAINATNAVANGRSQLNVDFRANGIDGNDALRSPINELRNASEPNDGLDSTKWCTTINGDAHDESRSSRIWLITRNVRSHRPIKSSTIKL